MRLKTSEEEQINGEWRHDDDGVTNLLRQTDAIIQFNRSIAVVVVAFINVYRPW